MELSVPNRHNVQLYLLVAFAYLAIAIFLFLPTIGNPFTTTLGHSGDIYQNMWDLWWVKYTLFKGINAFSTTYFVFWPAGFDLSYQTLVPISGLISIPFQIFGLVFSYNVLFFLGYAITGLCGFVLIKHITGSGYASFFGGLTFTFSAFHIAQEYGHIDFFFIGWSAIFVYFMLRLVEEEYTPRHAIALGVSALLVFFMDGVEEWLMVIIAAFVIFAYYAWRKDYRHKVLSGRFVNMLSLAVLTFFIIGLYWLFPIIRVVASPAAFSSAYASDTIYDNMQWSNNLLSFFLPSFYNGIFHSLSILYYNMIYYPGGHQDRIAYVGYSLIGLSAYGLRRHYKESKLWLLLIAVFGLLSLGPYLQVGPANLPIPGPYLIYHYIPVFNVLREPGRFALFLSLGMSVLASIGIKSLIEARSRSLNQTYLIVGIASLVFILESAGLPTASIAYLTMKAYVPQYLYQMAEIPGNFSFLVLPALPQPNNLVPALYTGLATYYTTVVQKPLVGGYVTRTTPVNRQSLSTVPIIKYATGIQYDGNYTYRSPIKENYTLQNIKALYDYRTRYIILENNAYNASTFVSIYTYLLRLFGFPVYKDQNVTIFSSYNATQANLYNKDFISFYIENGWALTVFGNYTMQGWTPINSHGIIVTYAPYPKGIDASNYNNISVNVTMHFTAQSPTPQVLFITSGDTQSSIYHNYSVEVNSLPQKYTLTVPMVAGSRGNFETFYDRFIVDGDANHAVLINNVTFSYNSTLH